jgi:hypothetical protein
MNSSNYLIVLPSGREVIIDLRNKRYCKINFLTGDFPGGAKSSMLHLNMIGYPDLKAQVTDDGSKLHQTGESLTLTKFPFLKSGLITINKKFTIDYPMQLKVTYEKADVDGFPAEVEMAYSVE